MLDDAALNAFHKLTELANRRREVYLIFARVFANPTPEFIEIIQSGEAARKIQDNLIALGVGQSHYEPALSGLVQLSEDLKEVDPGDLLTQLRVEYMRLFIGPQNPIVPIYETYYMDQPEGQRPLLFVSQAAINAEQKYREAGLKMSSHDSPDHLAIELEFLVYLCQKESEAWEHDNNTMSKKWRRLEQNFLDDHLGKWALTLCRQVQNETDELFYRYMASLTETFIYMETGAFRPR